MGPIIGAVVGAVVGGITSGLAAKEAAKNKARAYREAANLMKDANEKYSGKEGHQAMTKAAEREAAEMRSFNNSSSIDTGADTQYAEAIGRGKAGSSKATELGQQGWNLGAENKGEENAAQLNYAANKANNILKQADINAQVANAKNQAVMSGAAGLADVANKTGVVDWAKDKYTTWKQNKSAESGNTPSDERLKDPIDDETLIKAIEEFKSLKKRIEECKHANR